MPSMRMTRRPPAGCSRATSYTLAAGAVRYSGVMRSMNRSGRNSSTTAASSASVSHQRLLMRNQRMVTAANSSMARALAAITRSASKPWSMLISSSCGLKIQMKGRISVREA